MAEVRWSTDAEADLGDIVEFISRDSPVRARLVAHRIIERVEHLERFPGLGHTIAEDPTGRYRHVVYHPFRIIYRIDGERVFVIAIVHGARDWSLRDDSST